MERKEYTRNLWLFGLIFLLAVLFMTTLAYADISHRFYGYATDEAYNNIENGTVITAYIVHPTNGSVRVQNTTVDNSMVGKNYDFNTLTAPGALWDGGTIYFYIGNENTTNDSTFHHLWINDPNGAPFYNLTILDLPQITDNTNNTGTTGDNFTYNVSIVDYVDEEQNLTVRANWSHSTSSGNETLSYVGGSFFEGTIVLDHSLANMTYTIWVNDTSGKYNYSGPYNVTVTDNDNPNSSVTLISDYWKNLSDNPLTITGTADDNIGLKNVTLYYYYSSDNSSWSTANLYEVDNDPWASVSWSFSFPNNTGYYRFYSIATDNASNNQTTPDSNDTNCGYDNSTPSSSIDAISPYWQVSSPVSITCSATDSQSGIKNVTLYYRYSDDNSTWGSWMQNATDSSSPYQWSFTFPNGSGFYEFYSIAIDNVMNTESAPGMADARCGYDIENPTSSLNMIATYWQISTPLVITGNISDTYSGPSSNILYYYFSNDNSTFFGPFSGGVNNTPWLDINNVAFNFDFTTNGTGYYRFYSVSVDNASNTESAPVANDTICGYDPGAPTTSVTAIDPYWNTSTEITVSASASDSVSDMASVAFYYYNSTDNATWTGPYLLGTDTSLPYTATLNFSTNGSTYHRFYSRGTDNAGNVESAPVGNDTMCGADRFAPTSSVDAIDPYWNSTGSVVLTATASDNRSGLASVSFYYYNSSDNSSWTGPYLANTDISSPYSYTFTFSSFNSSGYYRFYSTCVDNAGNMESVPVANDTECAYGLPETEVNPISIYWQNSTPLTITATAIDQSNTIKNVTLYYYFSSDNSTFFGPFTSGVNNTPWDDLNNVLFSFDFTTNSSGFYRFYTVGADNNSNYETVPDVNDTACAYDVTDPTCVISIPVAGVYYNTMDTMSGTCSDGYGSGVKQINITLYNSTDNSYWQGSIWSSDIYWSHETPDSGYATWTFDTSGITWTNGSTYIINATAIDNVSNIGSVDSNTFYIDTDDLASNVDAISTYWQTSTPLAVTANATDSGSGLNNVTLYYYFSSDNGTFFGPFSGGVNSTPWIDQDAVAFSFDFTTNGTGYYRYYTVATDNASNIESTPVANDTICGYDPDAPTCTIQYNNSRLYYKNADIVRIFANFTELISGIDESSVKISINYSGGTDLSQTSMSMTDNTHWYYDLDITSGSSYNGQFIVNITASDNATNSLNPDPTNNNSKYIDNTVPSSSVNSIATYIQNSTDNLTITIDATDGYGGLKNVTLFYYNSSDNYTWNGPYNLVDNPVNTSPWINPTAISWFFNFTDHNGSGYYRFYSIAIDNATNVESAPSTFDTSCYYGLTNLPPYAATIVSPTNGSSTTSASVSLNWAYGGDPDGNDSSNATYNVYFEKGDSTPDVLVASNLSTTSQSVGASTSGTYYWMIVTFDNHSIGTPSEIWTFTKTTSFSGDGDGDGDTTDPTTPSNVRCTTAQTDNTPSFEWDASTDDSGISGYYVKIDSATETWIGNVLTWTSTTVISDGSHMFYVKAKDNEGNIGSFGSCSFTIDTSGVSGEHPIANAGGPYSGLTFENITFNGVNSTDDGTIENYTWNFGDGKIGFGVTINHSYNTSGIFNVTLTVTDNSGYSDSNKTTVNITLDSDADGWSDEMEESYGTNKTDKEDKPKDTDGDGLADEDSPDGKYEGDKDDDNDGVDDETEKEIGSNSTKKDTSLAYINSKIYYLIDVDGDGVPDRFYNYENKNDVAIKINPDGTILIDEDKDGNYDYTYDPASGSTGNYEEIKKPKEGFPWYILIIAIIIIIILIIIALFKTGYLYIEQEEDSES